MSTLPTYPAEDLDRGMLLLRQLGSFWVNIFEETDKLQTHLRSSATEQAQVHLNFMEALASVSRFTVPVFHTEDWVLLTIKLSDINGVPSVYKKGDLQYGPQNGLVANRPAGFTQTYGGKDNPSIVKVPLPTNMVDVPFSLQNTLLAPSRVWINGVDYKIDKERNLIVFQSDPFADTKVAHRDVFDDDGNKIDEEIAIWAYKGQFDLNHIYLHFGYVVGLQMKSSQNYKDLMNALWDLYVTGPSLSSFSLYVAALTGTPTVIDSSETVEVVRNEADSKLVITDSHVYRFSKNATITVSVGDVLTVGQTMCDAFEIIELSGANANFNDIPALSVSRSFLSGGYMSELVFKNGKAVVQYLGLDEDNKAVLRFETSGFPADVENFWDAVQTNGKAAGATLANLLDQRTMKVGEPSALALPSMINPLEFILNNILRNNLFVIRVKQASFLDSALGLQFFRYLRSVIPPHTTYIVLVDVGPMTETIDLDQAGGDNALGAEESASILKCTGHMYEDAYDVSTSPGGEVLTYSEVAVTVRYVSITCQ